MRCPKKIHAWSEIFKEGRTTEWRRRFITNFIKTESSRDGRSAAGAASKQILLLLDVYSSRVLQCGPHEINSNSPNINNSLCGCCLVQ
jgi:hypothetical protein